MIRKLIPIFNILAIIIVIVYSVKFFFFDMDPVLSQHGSIMFGVCFTLLLMRLVDYFLNEKGAFEDSSPAYFGIRMTRTQLCLMLSFLSIVVAAIFIYPLIQGAFRKYFIDIALQNIGSLANHLTTFYLIMIFTSKTFLGRFPPLSYSVSILVCSGVGYFIPAYLGQYFLAYLAYGVFPISQLDSFYGFAGVNMFLLFSVIVFTRIFRRITQKQTAGES